MALSLRETQAVAALASHLYDYLPASGAVFTFAEAAREAGAADLWPGVKGISKLPALTHLLESTLEHRRSSFCALIERIVRGGLKYRTRKGNPLTRPELENLNKLVANVGFKIPELWDEAFLGSLAKPAKAVATSAAPEQQSVSSPLSRGATRFSALVELKEAFLSLHGMEDRQQAGLTLEMLLNRLFGLFELAPEKPFRVAGEQIDGSFELDHEVYLLEAKWTKEPIDAKELYAFRGKVEGKSSYTRGLFLSISGYTKPAQQALTQGKTPNFLMMDGAHLYRSLEGQIEFDALLRRLVRHLAERGEPYLPVGRMPAGEDDSHAPRGDDESDEGRLSGSSSASRAEPRPTQSPIAGSR